MKSNIILSIVTPTYNQSQYLEETIESVLGQINEFVEFIVINDGSTDETFQILERYREDITVIHRENCGQSETLNFGWSICNGKYLTYLSSDDVLYKDSLKSVLDFVEKFSDYGVLYFDYDIIDSRSRFVKKAKTKEFVLSELQCDLICHPGLFAIFKKEVFEYTNGWNPSLKQVPDFDFWLRASKSFAFKHLDFVVGGYRVHDNSASFRAISITRASEIVTVIKDFYEFNTCNRAKNTTIKIALSNAYLICAKLNFQSKRFILGFYMIFEAIKNNFIVAFKLSTYRMLFSGLFRRFFYK